MSHGKVVCKCGKVIQQCRCMEGHKNITYTDRCEHEWWTELENELDKEYDVASYWDKENRYLEIDLPVGRHTLEVALTNVYGFVISLVITDETGGMMVEKDLHSCVKREHLADTIHSLYTSYE
ncbi:hypothetical protein HWB76_gp055 [Streptomyces phage Blueeyedbeauty]|uniref:Uncharacterized protein n=1 Tax=Streptomyces phage Blueeyedbeauty TaxID=2250336 RepID=A0A345L243_9CAUD|nr:hypothetical protein HWB76_gp055 [Streptomyces phage Blueeyedbeauty]AXH49345.1 hypothetical protein SEA_BLUEEYEDBEAUTY_238 [Streptomyces phage Blueeyedbeauty]